MKPLFSVIVPVYNVENFLPQCIESILGQTYAAFELILVDDGSTDSSGKICDKYAAKDQRIVVIHKNNGGLVSARQAGTKIAKGEYIVAVDGDDWVNTQLLDILNQTIEKYHPDVVCHTALRTTESQIQGIKVEWNMPYGLYEREQIIHTILPNLIRHPTGYYLFPNVWGKAFKRVLYTPCQMAVDTRITIGEDSCVTYPAISRASILVVLPQVLYYYRINPNSMSRTRQKGFSWQNISIVHQVLANQLADFKSKNAQINRNICHFLFNAATSWLQTNRPYLEVKKEILEQLSVPENQKAIQEATFSFPCKDWLAQFALQHKLIWLICLFAKLEMRFIKK